MDASAKHVQWAADQDDTYRELEANKLFLSRKSVYVTYPALNPLRIQATATVVAVDDPRPALIGKLIDGFTTFGGTIAPSTNKAALPPGSPTCANAPYDIDQLKVLLYGSNSAPAVLSRDIQGWVEAIDKAYAEGKSGSDAVKAGISAINADAKTFADIQDKAAQQWKRVSDCSTTAADPIQKGLYEDATLATQDHSRLQQLLSITKTMSDLSESLTKDYSDPTHWTGTKNTDYVVGPEVKPTSQKLQNVTVKITTTTFKVDPISSIMTISQEANGTATLTLGVYSPLIPEIGVGAVLGTLKTPVYGTGKNAAGQTVVAQTDTKSLSVNPTVLVNFVCRCGASLFAPMVQVGVATSKDLPAILLGGGVRLFSIGKGDVAVGGGALFGWYKDLQKLKIGDVIAGTSDINSDLGYITTPKVGAYVALQYKFSF